jgi:hypothetical protein
MTATTTNAPEVEFRLGKLPARPDAVKLKMTRYLVPAELPKPPANFGHDAVVGNWQMLGNDTVGDCVIAGGLHETMLWTANGSVEATMSTAAAIKNYSAITGYRPSAGPVGDNPTDQGTDMQVAASYRRRKGLVDAAGKRHKVGAYLAIDPGDLEQHFLAIYLFGAIGIGLNFPDSAMTQFRAGQPWTVVNGAKIEGGHYVSGIARRGGNLIVVTWGREQVVDAGFLAKYNDESIAYVSAEYLRAGKSPEGFDADQLNADLAAITSGQ